MLEKDIENLIAKYPKEFFPKEDFKLINQQHSIQGKRFDILFEDKYGRLIIVEVKRGILSREACGQIVEYYGLLKNNFPDKIIELILCANIIPTERKTFLETTGIECKEIPIPLLVSIAEKYSYSFLDSHKFKPETIGYDKARRELEKQSSDDINVWIFQANPREYDILNSLTDEEIGDNQHWYVGQHKDKIKKGHIGMIWMSGKASGIYAVVIIESDPNFMEEYEAEKKYWLTTTKETGKMLRVKLKIIKRLINYPVFREILKTIPELEDLSILRFAQGTNFPVKKDEWQIISKLIEEQPT